MPSRLTLVPGSQGPRHSGSVARATSQVFTPTERVRTMICSQGDEMSLLTTGTRRCKGSTAGVETGDSICGEGETCRSLLGIWEGEQVPTSTYIPGEPQAQAATFPVPVPAGSSSPTPHHRTRISKVSPILACPYTRNPKEQALCSHTDHTQKSLRRRYLLSCFKEFVPSSFARVIIPSEDASGYCSDVNAVNDFGPDGSLGKKTTGRTGPTRSSLPPAPIKTNTLLLPTPTWDHLKMQMFRSHPSSLHKHPIQSLIRQTAKASASVIELSLCMEIISHSQSWAWKANKPTCQVKSWPSHPAADKPKSLATLPR